MFIRISYPQKYMEEATYECKKYHIGYRPTETKGPNGEMGGVPSPWLEIDDAREIGLEGTKLYVMNSDGQTIERYSFPIPELTSAVAS